MHALGAVNFRICLALKYHGNSISANSYDFCPHLAQLDTLDFTLSHRGYRVHNNGYNYLVLSSSIEFVVLLCPPSHFKTKNNTLICFSPLFKSQNIVGILFLPK